MDSKFELDKYLQPLACDAYLESVASRFERMRRYLEPNGAIHPDFLEFCSSIKEALLAQDWLVLYARSDHALPKDVFIQYFKESIGDTWVEDFLSTPIRHCGVDLVINQDRLDHPNRNVLGGLYLTGYRLIVDESDIRSEKSVKLDQKVTELLFTYKFNRYMLVSKFSPWQTLQESL